MPDEATWPIEDHTSAKHELLRRYLGAWFPILVSRGFVRRVLFLDGFAGPGIYRGGEPGSPIIAMSIPLES
jgi:three-Cys-motif partner protein